MNQHDVVWETHLRGLAIPLSGGALALAVLGPFCSIVVRVIAVGAGAAGGGVVLRRGRQKKKSLKKKSTAGPHDLITWNCRSPSAGHVSSSWSASCLLSSYTASWSVCGSSLLSLWSFPFPCPSLSPCRRPPRWPLCSPLLFQSPHHQSLHLLVHHPL